MTSSVKTGPIQLESLTVRLSDFHPVARKVVLENGERIDIAEVAFDVVPWERVNPDWFEPTGSVVSPASVPNHAGHGTPAPAQLTEGEVDLAALSALKALEELHADTERLEVNRTGHGIEVTGVVESDSRKQQLQARLRIIPHVRPEILSYQEMDSRNAGATGAKELSALSVTSSDSQLDVHCRAVNIAHDDCQRWSYRLLNATTVLTRDSRKLAQLQFEYPAGKSLTAEAKTMLASLVAGHLDHLNAALWDQQQTLQRLQLWPDAEAENEETSNSSLTGAVDHNQASIHELVYASYEGARPAATIARDVAHSLEETRKALSYTPTYAANKIANSSGTSTPQE
jgi:hypothetical protein